MTPTISYIGRVEVRQLEYGNRDYAVLKLLIEDARNGAPNSWDLLHLPPDWEGDGSVPLRCQNGWPNVWIHKRKAFHVDNAAGCTPDEIAIRIQHMVLKKEHEYERIKAEVATLKNLERAPSARRERIPQSVQMFVWQRDQGRCVRCGGRERLEFDHIIPVAEGGSSTERNIQLLCEACNRKKGRRVG